MKTNSLSTKGLSMTQAQTVSNLIFQSAREIDRKLAAVNNVHKVLNYQGRDLIKQQGNPLPSDLKELLLKKARYHATQAFLVENIKAKDALINKLKSQSYISDIEVPVSPVYEQLKYVGNIDENDALTKLTVSETNEWLEQEAIAAHIGQFIHKGGILDKLRDGATKIETLQWETIQDGVGVKNFPLVVTINEGHTPEELLVLHEELSALYRAAEQRVNYFKAKIKNIVTEENARIARVNQDEATRVQTINNALRNTYTDAMKTYSEEISKKTQAFNADQFDKIKATHSLKIAIDPRFQETINEFLDKLTEK